MATSSNKRSIDDLDLEECCRAVKKMAICPRGELVAVAGDKIQPTVPKTKKKPWRLQMQLKQTDPKKKTTQQSCSPLKALEEQISVMLKAIRNSCQNIEGAKVQEVKSTLDLTKKGKSRSRRARNKPYQSKKPGREDNRDKNPGNDIPVASLPILVAPIPASNKLKQSESTCSTPKNKKVTKTVAPGTADVMCSSNKNTDKDAHTSHKRKRPRKSDNSVKKRRLSQEDSHVEELVTKFAKLAL